MEMPLLTTPKLTMRPFVLDDAEAVQRLAGDRNVALTTASIPHPYEDGMAEVWISGHQSRWEVQESLTLALTIDTEGVVGAAGLVLNMVHCRGEIGYWVGRDYWNRGYATEATLALIKYGFEELMLQRIQARYFLRNPASKRVMEKSGMQYEGVLRKYVLVRGSFEDLGVYSILKSEATF
jgi:RimJ/RimL family protein N-acetyltransferase